MKTSVFFSPARLVGFAFFLAAMLWPAATYAKLPPGVVSYTPTDETIEGVMPLTWTYVLSVTSPPDYTPGTVSTVTMRAGVNSASGGDLATAASYVSFSPSTLTFNDAAQTQDVTVTVNFPILSLPVGTASADYSYQIYSDGWPSGITDSGASINASVSVPPASMMPVVTITTPADGATIAVPYTSMPTPVTIGFTATSPDANAITWVAVDLDGVRLSLDSTTGLNTTSVQGSVAVLITTPGSHTVRAYATSADGTTSDTSTFNVQVSYPPPSVVITTPTPGSQYYYRYEGSPVDVQLSFTGTGSYGKIIQLSATLDGAPTLHLTTTNLGTLAATGTADMLFTDINAGFHQVHVAATDEFGQVATADTNFTVNTIAPVPAISISSPANGTTLTIPVGATTIPVSYTFTTTVQNGYNVDTVSANLGTTALSFTTSGLNTPSATSTGTIDLPVGNYTLTATGGIIGQTATASVSFTVKATAVPPSVVINTPAVGYTQAIVPGTTATVPLTFVGTSNTPGYVITKLAATLDGTNVPVASSTLNQVSAAGTATLSVTASGTHHIVVTATDAAGTATAMRDFTITYLTSHQISGLVFFDIDGNGAQNGADFGLAFVTVQLLNSSNQVVQSTTTDPSGSYAFTGLYPGTYTVVANSCAGLVATTPMRRTISMASANVVAAPIGYKLNLCALQCMTANGQSMGFWKTNISKAISGSTKGVQVSAATLANYTTLLGDFALTPFDGLTMKQALATMSSKSSAPTSLLAKQLLPAEYNYENGAYINGNATLTFAFVAWGEAVMQNSSSYSSSYITWAASWFESYNTSEGGTISGSSCSGSSDGSSSDDNGGWGCSSGGSDDDRGGSDSSWGSGDGQGGSGCSWGGGDD